ncbi:hypothetical protein BGZ63DRAFT_399399 [Mariannaea sp. PMI_226]|nr:hypothetical protein BGZ63DRAFT_399399 [Mariannaea sp. PMI_226]
MCVLRAAWPQKRKKKLGRIITERVFAGNLLRTRALRWTMSTHLARGVSAPPSFRVHLTHSSRRNLQLSPTDECLRHAPSVQPRLLLYFWGPSCDHPLNNKVDGPLINSHCASAYPFPSWMAVDLVSRTAPTHTQVNHQTHETPMSRYTVILCPTTNAAGQTAAASAANPNPSCLFVAAQGNANVNATLK